MKAKCSSICAQFLPNLVENSAARFPEHRRALKRRGSMKLISGSVACLLIASIAAQGCSKQSQDEYHSAGQSLTHAAKETGQAIKTDAKIAGEKTKQAENNVKSESKEHAAKPPVKK
jgi:hypothetical protein